MTTFLLIVAAFALGVALSALFLVALEKAIGRALAKAGAKLQAK